MLKPAEALPVKRIFPFEPDSVVTSCIQQQLPVASPLFQFGFKEPRANQIRTERMWPLGRGPAETLASMRHRCSDLLDRGLVNEASFSYEYFEGNGYATPMFSGESKDPQAVAKSILTQGVQRFQKEGIPPEAFERSKRCLCGGDCFSPEQHGEHRKRPVQHGAARAGAVHLYRRLAQLRPEDAELQQIFQEGQSVLSVILPLEP